MKKINNYKFELYEKILFGMALIGVLTLVLVMFSSWFENVDPIEIKCEHVKKLEIHIHAYVKSGEYGCYKFEVSDKTKIKELVEKTNQLKGKKKEVVDSKGKISILMYPYYENSKGNEIEIYKNKIRSNKKYYEMDIEEGEEYIGYVIEMYEKYYYNNEFLIWEQYEIDGIEY